MKNKGIISIVIVILFSLTVFISCGEEEMETPVKEDSKQTEMKEQTQADTKKEKQMPAAKEQSEKEKMAKEKKPKSMIPETYEVQEGETLELIAEKFYGDSQMWFKIFAENEGEIDCWNKILPGQTLQLPQPKQEKEM